MSSQPSLVDSNYYQDGESKEANHTDGDNLVSYDGDDVEMKDGAQAGPNGPSESSSHVNDNIDEATSSSSTAPPPLPPGFFSQKESAQGFQLMGVFPERTAEPCSTRLQNKVNGFLERIQRGEVPTPVRHIRSTKNFNNPEILSEIVSQFEIVEHGSHLKTDVWSPFGFPSEDYIDALQVAGAPKPAPPVATPAKPTTGADAAPSSTTSTPITPGSKSTTIITRKSGATSANTALAAATAAASTAKPAAQRQPSLTDLARVLAQGFPAPVAPVAFANPANPRPST